MNISRFTICSLGLVIIIVLSFQGNFSNFSLSSPKHTVTNRVFSTNAPTQLLSINQSNCWTILIYMSADNNLEQGAVNNINEMVQGSLNTDSCVHFLLQVDRSSNSSSSLGYSDQPLPGQSVKYSGSHRYVITNGSLTPLTGSAGKLGEIDMANESSLESFLSWGLTSYPANHTLLIIWGYGFPYLLFDESSQTYMSSTDLHDAIQQAEQTTHQTLDLIGFDASSMATANILLDLKDVTNGILAPETPEPEQSWDYNQFFSMFQTPIVLNLSPDSLARSFLRSYDSYCRSVNITSVEFGYFNTMYLNALYQTLHDFSLYAKSQFQNTTVNANFNLTQIITFASVQSNSFSPDLIDLVYFMYMVEQYSSDSILQGLAAAVISAIQYSSNKIKIGSSLSDVHGISILFPDLNSSFDTLRNDSKDSLSSTYWFQFINSFEEVLSSQSFKNFSTSNLISLSFPIAVHVSISINESNKLNNIFQLVSNRSQIVSYSLISTNPMNSGGKLMIYEELAGGRMNFEPSLFISVPSFSTSFSGSANFTFEFSNVVYLKAEFIPANSQYNYGSSPFFSSSQLILISDNSSHIVPYYTNGNNLVFSPGNLINFNFSLLNKGNFPYTGGMLTFLIENDTNYTILNSVSMTITSFPSNSIYNMSVNLGSSLTSGIYRISILLDNQSIINRIDPNLYSFPENFVIMDPLQQLQASLSFNYKPSYLLNQFFIFDAMNLDPTLVFSLPSTISSVGGIQYTLLVKNQASNVYIYQGDIISSSWQKETNQIIFNSTFLPSFASAGSILTPGSLYSFVLTTNVTGSINLLPDYFYFQPFLSSQSHVIITNLSVNIDYSTNKWYITASLSNIGNVPVNNSFDYTFLQIYSLTNSSYYSIFRKNIGTGLPSIPAYMTINDSVILTLNPDNFPSGLIIINYNYYNSLGAYDPQLQSVSKYILLTHDYIAPVLNVSFPQVVSPGIPFTVQGSITDSNPYSFSIYVDSQLITNGLFIEFQPITYFYNQSSSNSNIITVDFALSVVLPHNGSFILKFIASDLSLNLNEYSQIIQVIPGYINNSNNFTSGTMTSSQLISSTSGLYSSSQNITQPSSSSDSGNKTSPNFTAEFILLSLISLFILRKIRK